jgi:hypothetical protein
MTIFDPLLDLFRGKALTIPPMDGALKPNKRLDDADVVAEVERPDSLIFDGASVIYASGNRLQRIGATRPLREFPANISALALAPDGRLAVGLDSGLVMVGDEEVPGFNCPTAFCFAGEDLIVCNGSGTARPEDWVEDLMRGGATGSLWRVDLATKARTCLARDLAYPFGAVAAGDRVVFSESWRHRLVSVPLSGGQVTPVLSRLPAYPCRLTALPDGYLLALFAPLNRLVEFVLQEDQYRAAMMDEIESRYWIAPTLSASRTFLEPLQNGGVRSMGVHKAWSPTRSYGLLVRLDTDFRPVDSYHSRADGHHHGITSALEIAGRLVVASKGGNVILAIDPLERSA